MSGPLKYDYSKLKGNPADAPGLSSYLAGLYLPLSGAVPMAGALDMGGFNFNNAEEVNANFVNAGGIDATTSLTLNSVPVATTEYVDDEVSANGVSLQAFASNASNLTSGTVADARLSSNVPLKNAANTFTVGQTVQGTLACGSIDVTPVNASWLFSGTEALIKRGNTGIGTASGGFGSTSLFFSVNSQNSMCLVPGSGMGWLLLNNSYMIGFTSSPVSSHATTTLSEASTGVMQIGTSGASGKNALGSLNLTNLTASGVIGSATGSDLTLRAATATLMLQVSGGGFTPCRLSPGTLAGPSQLGLSSTNNASSPDAFLNVVSAGLLSVTSDIGKTTLGSLNLANLTASGTVATGAGSAAACSIQIASAGMGFYQAGASSIGVSIAGAQRAQFWSDGSLYLNGSAPWFRIGSTNPVTLVNSASGLNVTSDGSTTTGVNCSLAKFTGYPTSLLPAAASNAGSITYDTTLSKHVGCDGSTWNALW